ncbi:2-oxo acid dehydrogenase subunit E2 [Micromonospora sp. NPDC126480]|uniref:2-oxo acid dehydrogenase subunit E2 n=1 Tax=Micromonospora sp. NPDC126480 TaxID=3155312 RepID=UPI00332D0157
MHDLTVPKLNNNDDSYVLVDWLFQDGDQVPDGEAVAVVETSKAAQDLLCDAGGTLHRLVAEKSECRPGQTIAWLFADEAERQRHLDASAAAAAPADGDDPEGLVITATARQLMDEHGISDEAVRGLGKAVVKRADIERLISADRGGTPPGPAATGPADNGGRRRALDRRQRAIAEVVAESARTIPAAFTVIKVDVGEALAFAARRTADGPTAIGLVELVVKAIARARPDCPAAFARLVDPGTLELADAAHVGVTIDVGRGLSIPVVRHADGRSLADIADTLMDLRIRSLRDDLQESHLADGVITLSLSNDEAVVFTRPIVFPGQTCMVSLGGVLDETVLDATTNEARPRRVVHLGLAYDHRVLNGRDAVAFLQGLRTTLESPQRLTGLDLTQ